MDAERIDIAVAGAGIAGLATALALRTGPGPKPSVVVSDPRLAAEAPVPSSLRAVAIAPGSRRLLQRLGAWEAVAAAAQPITRMVLGDTRPGAVPAPELLRFEGDDGPLAHMVLQDALHAALLSACRSAGVRLAANALSGPVPEARLVVAADGGRSRLREAAGIASIGRDYGQTAITATLRHDRDHDGEALQVFLPGGPLALLPLRAPDGTGRWTSIVWTERTAEAARLLALSADGFCAALRDRGGHTRGDIALLDAPAAHPLAIRMGRRLVASRLALVGDAARTIHPLAGQGLNLGLQDAEALAGRVRAALALGLDPGAPRVLAAYERDRRADQVAMAAATDGLNRLFSNDRGPVRLVRGLGLGLVDRLPALKRALVRRAAGARFPSDG